MAVSWAARLATRSRIAPTTHQSGRDIIGRLACLMVFDRPNQLFPRHLNGPLTGPARMRRHDDVWTIQDPPSAASQPGTAGGLAPLPQRLSLRPSRGRLECQLGSSTTLFSRPPHVRLPSDSGKIAAPQGNDVEGHCTKSAGTIVGCEKRGWPIIHISSLVGLGSDTALKIFIFILSIIIEPDATFLW